MTSNSGQPTLELAVRTFWQTERRQLRELRLQGTPPGGHEIGSESASDTSRS
jgi:hypothetical protein